MLVSKYTLKTASYRKVSLTVPLAAAVIVAGLAGCRGHGQYAEIRGVAIADPSAVHPITVSKAPVEMDIEVPRGSSGLTRSQASGLKAFVARYRSEGEGRLVVSAPSGGSNEHGVVNAVSNVRNIISDAGISGHAVQMDPYYVSGHSSPPIKVSFTTLVAKGPECGRWTKDLSRSPRNKNYGNFGCTQQHNLAAMAANPRDLVHPRGMDPRSSERRDVIFDKWTNGEPTGAEKSSDERAGTISEVGN